MSSTSIKRVCSLHNPPTEVKKLTAIEPWYCDRVNVIKFDYLWKIENFTSFQGETTSVVFTANDCSEIKWQMAISKIGRIVILKLKLVSSKQSRIKFKFKGKILTGENGEETGHSIGKETFYTARPNDVFIFPRPIELEDLKNNSSPRGILLNDTLSLACEIRVIVDIMDIQLGDIFNTESLESTLYEDMSKLLESGKFSDVSLIVAGKELRAHKAILSLRSKVFAAMFDHEMMEENTSNRVAINDFDYPIFRELLTFMYSNKSPNIDYLAVDLLAAADKYDLKKLKEMCAAVLDRDISIDAALPTLVSADRHCADALRARCLHFIKSNIAKLLQTDAWQAMAKYYPDLIDDIENYNGCIY